MKHPIRPLHLTIFAIVLICALLVTAIWYKSGEDARYKKKIQPVSSFTRPQQSQPDYTQTDVAWAFFPTTRPAGAWETPWGSDVFFIHGTTSDSAAGWNARTDDINARLKLEASMLPNFAAPFQSAGPIYAPFYRQATAHALHTFDANSDKALELAYSDVKAAFEYYLENENQGRAIALVGVEQGGLYAQRLLDEFFRDEDLKRRLVAAYLIETPTLEKSTPLGLPVCTSDESIQCIAAWSSIHPGDKEDASLIMSRAHVWEQGKWSRISSDDKMACFNPVLGWYDTIMVEADMHRGGASSHAIDPDRPPEIFTNAVATQCVDGFLIVSDTSYKELKQRSGLKNRYMMPDFNLFYADLQRDALHRSNTASAWLDKNAPKPAPPMPTGETIEESPINKIEKLLGVD